MTDATRHVVIATAGHVDHGKSAIVRALTGTDPDRLPEERRRGMTIDLGFAHLTLQSPEGEPIDAGLVDVPGHEDFVKNMVAGVGAVDAALLVIAADDGPMPQTQEHVQILTYMGVRDGVVALSKIDLCADVPAAVARVRTWLTGTSFADAPIVPTSVRTNSGLDELRSALAEVLWHAEREQETGRPRLSVDRVFVSAGAGTIVTGTLTGGRLTRGQNVLIQPAGHPARVRGIQTHYRDADHAVAGSRVALNLPGIAAAEGRSGPTIGRGDVVTIDGVGRVTTTIDVSLVRTLLDPVPVREAVRDGSIVRVHHRSTAVNARVRFGPPDCNFARLTLDRPLHVLIGDRIVLRDAGGRRTLAGGTVLDVAPPARRRPSFGKNTAQLSLLMARQAGGLNARVTILSAIGRDGWIGPDAFRPTFPLSDTAIDAAFAQAIEQDTLPVAGRYVIDPAVWNAAARAIRIAVESHHATHPQQQGLAITALDRVIRPTLPSAVPEVVRKAILDAVIEQLCRQDLVRTATVLHHTSHRPALPPRLQAAGDAILKVLTAHPFDPPSSKEICRTDAMIEAMKFLIATGRAVDLGQHTVLGADAYADAIERIRAQLKVTGSATVSELKATLGSSRRIMVPLLERLDRERVTRRAGDVRTLF